MITTNGSARAGTMFLGTAMLSVLALLGNWLSLSLFFGVDLIFGSVAVMLAVAWLGVRAAAVVALIGGLYTLVLWGHPYAVPGFVLEGLIVGWLVRRRRWNNMVMACLAFWVILGVPLVLFFYGSVMGMATSAVWLVALKQAVNGVLNALLASLVLLAWHHRHGAPTALSLRLMLFHCLLAAILVAGILPIIIDARMQREQHERVVAERLADVGRVLDARLLSDSDGEERLVYHLSRMAMMFPDINTAVIDADGNPVAQASPLRSRQPGFSGDSRSSQSGLHIWLPDGDYGAVARWRAGYYWAALPLTRNHGWQVVVEQSAEPIVQRMERQRLNKFLLLTSIMLLAILLAFLISRVLSLPLMRLANRSLEIERAVLAGNFVALERSRFSEIDALVASLNRMGVELAASVKVLRDSRGELADSVASRTRELADTNALLSSVLDAAEDFSIVATDRNGLITLFNSGAERLLGYKAVELVGLRTPAILHDPKEVQSVARQLSQEYGTDISGFRAFVYEAEQRKRVVREWTYIDKYERRIPVRLVITVIHDAAGRIAGYLGVAEDVTERKRLEQIKNDFVATVSHELRTPLTSITGALGMLRAGVGGTLPAQAVQMVTLAHQNGERLTELINDLLDIEKIAAGKIDFHYEILSLPEQLEQAVHAISHYAPTRQVRVSLAKGVPSVFLRADAHRLQQVLANLLSNAVKFSPIDGKVQLYAQIAGGYVRVIVEDEGAGIPDGFKDRVFQRFAQADSSARREKGGTGLGLAISRELIEHMGGRIGFESPPGKGTTFWFELPCAVDQQGCSDEVIQGVI